MLLYDPARPDKGNYKPNVTFHIIQALRKGKVIFGTMFREFTFLNEMIKKRNDPVKEAYESGYGFLIIDCEHKAFNEETLAELAERAHEVGISIWIRPEQTNEPPISMYADIGFSGFMIPNVNFPQEAKFVVDRAYFPPIASPIKEKDRGRRGFSLGDIPRDGQNFKNIKDGEKYVNKNTLVTVQTEHPVGITNLSDILSIRGVYGTIIGTNDLARGIAEKKKNRYLIKLDFSEMYRDKLMMEAYKIIAKICQSKGKYAGFHFTEVNEIDLVKKLIEEFGYQFIILGRDRNFNNEQFIKLMEKYK